MNQDFAYADEYGLLGSNFYWKNRSKVKDVSEEDLIKTGITSERVQIHKDILEALLEIDREFQKKGFRIYIKEGYRPVMLYELVYKKRVELFGKERTDKLLNMKDMPHATGRTVDIALWNIEKDEEVFLRSKDDGDEAYFVDFYKNKNGKEAEAYQKLQELLIRTMQEHGFRLGTKREYFHFDYKPETPKNY